MRICRGFCLKMLRSISRLNIVLVIVCLGGMLFIWNRCQIEQFEKRMNRVVPAVLASNTQQYKSLEDDRSIDERAWEEDDIADQQLGGKTNSLSEENEAKNKKDSSLANNNILYKNIEVLVNGETKIQGRLENKEVYIPFSFIKDYFEIEGKIVRGDFGKQFHVQHTSYNYFTPTRNTYDPHGSFLWFLNYNVEGRSRVKCITGVDEVPVSTQWGEHGYKYPIQIAQYGLSHYSMWLEMPQGTVKVVDDCEKTENQEWVADGKWAHVKNAYNSERQSRVMEFSTNGRCHILGTFSAVFDALNNHQMFIKCNSYIYMIYHFFNDLSFYYHYQISSLLSPCLSKVYSY